MASSPRLAPTGDIRFSEFVPQKSKARHDQCVAIVIRLDIHQRHRQHVAALGAFDKHRPGHGVHQVQIQSGQIISGRTKIQVAIEGVARRQDDELTRLGARDRFDGGVVAVKAMRIVLAVGALFVHHDFIRTLHIRRVSKGRRHNKYETYRDLAHTASNMD